MPNAKQVDDEMQHPRFKIAILGWGSLLWDRRPDFEAQHANWRYSGPKLNLEFSRISETRAKALTLVIDWDNGRSCKVAYALSKRSRVDDAICDLRCREGTTLQNIGFYIATGNQSNSHNKATLEIIRLWTLRKRFHATIWTDLESNFKQKRSRDFSVAAAISHIQEELDEIGKVNAAEYIWRAPAFVKTDLREALQSEPWFAQNTQP